MNFDFSNHLPTFVGLAIGLALPIFLVTPIVKPLSDPPNLYMRMVGQAIFLAIVTAVLAIVVYWEKRPLSSIDIQPWSVTSILWGLGAAAALMWVIAPFSLWVINKLGISGFDQALKKIAILPIWFRIVAIVITGGLFEEIIYRGFALERIAELSESYWIAGIVTLSIFAWMHYPLWGLGPVVTFYMSGGFLTLFFVWRQDLVANIIAHIAVDLVGLILYTPRSE